MVRVRFAPSPTGALHIGGARTALFNYLIAREAGGKFLLRIDDTDYERSKAEFETDIVESLTWLGLHWDEGPDVGGEFGPYRQSERMERHVRAANFLVEKNLAYRDNEQVVRLRYPNEEVTVHDRVCGDCVFHPQSLGPEVILLRSDGTPTYHLASVSDDIEMGITHVVRGQDHLTNTAKHLVLFHGLGHPGPQFAHLPLILGTDGSKLSKRNSTGMTLVSEFRAAGYLPEALNNYLLLLGWSHPEAKEQLTLEEAISVFSVERIGKTASVFDPARLEFLNGWWLRHVSVERLAHLLQPAIEPYAAIIERRGGAYWFEVVRFLQGEITSLASAPMLFELLFNLELRFSEAAEAKLNDSQFLGEVAQVFAMWKKLLHEMPVESGESYSAEEFSKLFALMKKSVPVEKKSIFQGLRLAIMGDLKGPELNALVPLITRELLISRVEQAVQRASSSI